MHPDIPELESQLNNATDPLVRIDLLNELAWAINLDDQVRSRALAEQAYELACSGDLAESPYLLGLAGSLRSLAALNNDAGDYDVALSQSLHALEILENTTATGSYAKALSVNVLGNISWTYRSLGDYGLAAEYGIKGLKLAQQIGDYRREAGMLNVLGAIYGESGDLRTSLEMVQKVLERYREVGYIHGEGIALNNLAMTYFEMGEGEKALQACQESLQLARKAGINLLVLTALDTMGEICLGLEDFTGAEDYLCQALSLAREQKIRSEELLCLLNLGRLYQRQQNEEAALSNFQSALLLSQTLNDRRGEFQCHRSLSEVYEQRGEFEAALRHFKQFHALNETVFNENTARRLAGLQVAHQVETAKRDAEFHYLKTIELKKEIEERKTAQADLEKLAGMDPLTGVLNRREFFLLGEREVSPALQAGRPLTAILFDLDHFKRINDTYGHAVGDMALIQATKTARESLRQGEIIGRYGGDEFVILLPGSNSIQAQQIAERLREKIASQVLSTTKGDLSLTLSFGIAELEQSDPSTLETLLAHADEALYIAKRAGRNQLAVYNGS